MNYLLILLVLLLLTVIGLVANKYVLGKGTDEELTTFKKNSFLRDFLFESALWFIKMRESCAEARINVIRNMDFSPEFIEEVHKYNSSYANIFITYKNTFKLFKNDYDRRTMMLLKYEELQKNGGLKKLTSKDRKSYELGIQNQFQARELEAYKLNYDDQEAEDILNYCVWSILESLTDIKLILNDIKNMLKEKDASYNEKSHKNLISSLIAEIETSEYYIFNDFGSI